MASCVQCCILEHATCILSLSSILEAQLVKLRCSKQGENCFFFWGYTESKNLNANPGVSFSILSLTYSKRAGVNMGSFFSFRNKLNLMNGKAIFLRENSCNNFRDSKVI